MVNTQIRQFREDIISATNASPLPIEVKRLVFGEVMQQINNMADKVINEEIAQAREAAEKEGEDDEQSVQED